MTFTQWWEQNKAVYEPIITKEIAQVIWCAAVDSLQAALMDELRKKYT